MSDQSKSSWGPIIFASVFPTIVTLAYFVWLADGSEAIQKGCYAIGKTIQFAFPVIWVYIILKRKQELFRFSMKDLGLGIGFGVAVVLAMFGLYFLWMKPAGLLVTLQAEVTQKISGFGIDTVWKYAVLGAFYALCHSLLEEYYWRWFVFRELKDKVSLWNANIISSIGFMAHHVVLLGTYFEWSLLPTAFFSFSVAVGGVFWAWLYHRTNSLFVPWMSHLIVDASIFVVGYDLAF